MNVFFRKFRNQKLAVVSFVVLLIIIVFAAVGPYVTPYDPDRPVLEQYAHKHKVPTQKSEALVAIEGVMSDQSRTKLDEVSIESLNKQVATARLTEQGVEVVAIGKGTASIVLSSGEVSTVISVEVSALERESGEIAQLEAGAPQSALKKGKVYQIELDAFLTDGEKRSGLEEIQKILKNAEPQKSDQPAPNNGFVFAKKKSTEQVVRFTSLDPDVIQVNEKGSVRAIGMGVGKVKIEAGPVSTVVSIPVETTDDSPYLVQIQPDQFMLTLADLNKHQPPSTLHWFGTDHQNRDIFSRVIVGTRETLFIGFVSVAIGATIGTMLGLLAGYYGRWMDALVMRVTDTLLAFPGILVAIAVIAILGAGTLNIIFAIAVFTIPIFTRIVRGCTLTLKQMTYVEAAKSIGVGNAMIMLRHLLPGMLPIVMVYVTMRIGTAILIGASLSFLGLGGDITAAEWGAMLSAAKDNSRDVFYPTLFPGLAIVMTVLAFNLLGDGLRDALDPRLRESR